MVLSYISITFLVGVESKVEFRSEGKYILAMNPLSGHPILFSYDSGGEKNVSIEILLFSSPLEIGLYGGNSTSGFYNVTNIARVPVTARLYAPNGGTSYYTINSPAPSPPPMYSIYTLGFSVQYHIYIPNAEGGGYSSYTETPLAITDNRRFRVGNRGGIGVLIPGQYVLVNTEDTVLPHLFSIVSRTSIPNENSIGYTTSTGGAVPFNPNPDNVNFNVPLTFLAKFYTIKEGRYTIMFENKGMTSSSNANVSSTYIDALSTVKGTLDLIGRGSSTVNSPVGIVSLL